MTISMVGGLLSATLMLLSLFLLPGLAFISYIIAPLPFFFLGFWRGLQPLLGAGVLATTLLFLFEGPILSVEFLLFSFLGPVFLIHRFLVSHKNSSGQNIWYSPSFLLRDFTLLSGIVMIIVLGRYLYLIQDGNIYVLIKNILSIVGPQENVKNYEKFVTSVVPFLPGIFTLSWMFMMLLNAMVAQRLLVHLKMNLRPTPSYKEIHVPKSFLIASGLSLVLSFVGVGTLELLGKNAALTLTFPFLVSGLGILHSLFHKITHITPLVRSVLTFALYSILLLLLWPALFVVLLGMLKSLLEKSSSTN